MHAAVDEMGARLAEEADAQLLERKRWEAAPTQKRLSLNPTVEATPNLRELYLPPLTNKFRPLFISVYVVVASYVRLECCFPFPDVDVQTLLPTINMSASQKRRKTSVSFVWGVFRLLMPTLPLLCRSSLLLFVMNHHASFTLGRIVEAEAEEVRLAAELELVKGEEAQRSLELEAQQKQEALEQQLEISRRKLVAENESKRAETEEALRIQVCSVDVHHF